MAGAIDQSKTITWLHLSDLHCRSKTRWDSHGPLNQLKKDLQDMERRHQLSPDLIFFTGDLAFGAVPDESITTQFEEGHAFLESIRQVFEREVTVENVFLVPGNHDVNRGKATKQLNSWLDSRDRHLDEIIDLIQSGGTSWSQYMERLADYREFLQRHRYAHLVTDPDRLIYGVMREIKGMRIGVVGLNSAWSSGGDAHKGQLWCGGRWQIKQLTLQLRNPDPDFTIALIHHPVNWFGEHEDPALLRTVEGEVHFLLHGHEDQGWVSAGDGHTRIAAGACYDRQGADKSGYNFVRLYLDSGEGEVWLRKYESGGWIPRIIPGKTDDHGMWPLTRLEFLRGIRTGSPELKVPERPPELTNLPPGEPNRYIHRGSLEEDVVKYLSGHQPNGDSPRLITLHASGGMGKTRLAVACGRRAFEQGMFRDGVFFVSLDGKKDRSKETVAEAIGKELRMTGESALPDNLQLALSDKEILLILDNYESVACGEVAAYLGRLVTKTRAVRLLVTGREAVKLGNISVTLNLDEGMTREEAGQLFVARAGLIRGRGWQPGRRDNVDLDRIVDLTECVPLAIELAAAWVDKRTLGQIADGLNDTPMVKAPEDVAMDPRQASVCRSLDWSFGLLEDWAKEGFVRLGIFPDAFTAEAVDRVCGLRDAQGLLDRLQRAALLVCRLEDGRAARYRMHRATHAYIGDKLKRRTKVFRRSRQRFVDYVAGFREVAVLVDQDAATPAAADIRAALEWLETEWHNVYACVESAFADDRWDAVAKLSEAVVCFCQARGHLQESQKLYEKLAESASHGGVSRIGQGIVLNALGVMYQYLKRWGPAERALERALEMRQGLDRAKTLNTLGTVCQNEEKWPEAGRCHEEGLKICRDLGTGRPDRGARREEARTLNNLGPVYEQLGRAREADEALACSLKIWTDELGDARGEADTYNNLGQVYQSRGEWPRAQECYQRRLDRLESVGDEVGGARTLNALGYVHRRQKHWKEAEECHQRALAMCRNVGDCGEESVALKNLAELYEEEGRLPEAAKAFQDIVRLQQGVSVARVRAVRKDSGEGEARRKEVNRVSQRTGEEQTNLRGLPGPSSKLEGGAGGVRTKAPVAKNRVFLSYCRENVEEVRQLRDDLIRGGEPVWWDQDILPGVDWKFAVRQAMKHSYAVVLCLSKEAEARATSGIFPEAADAIGMYREHAPGSIFIIPVRLSDCEIPPIEIDATRTLDRIQYVDLFPHSKRAEGLQRLLSALKAAADRP